MGASVSDRFTGVWALRAIRDRVAGGRETDHPDFGADPCGLLVYTASGHVSVNFMRRNRKAWAMEDQPSAAERASAAAGYGAYAGRFTVLEAERIVRHHVEVALVPNRVGRDLDRRFSFENGNQRLILRPHLFDLAGRKIERTLTWERIG